MWINAFDTHDIVKWACHHPHLTGEQTDIRKGTDSGDGVLPAWAQPLRVSDTVVIRTRASKPWPAGLCCGCVRPVHRHLKTLLRKWRDPKYIFKRGAIPYSWTKRLKTDYGWNVNTSFSLNTGRIKTLPVEIAAGLYREWRADSKTEMHRAKTSRKNPDKEQSRGTCTPEFKAYHSAAAIETWQGMGSTKQIHGTSSGTGLRGVVRWFSVKVTNSKGKEWSLQQMGLEQLDTDMQEKEPWLSSHYTRTLDIDHGPKSKT